MLAVRDRRGALLHQNSTGNSSQVWALSVEPRVRLGGLGGFTDYVCVFALLQLPRIALIRPAPCFFRLFVVFVICR